MKPLKTIIFILLVFSNYWAIGQNYDIAIVKENDTTVYTIVEDMPSYPGGDNARLKFLQSILVYPEKAKKRGIQGTVYITFVVDTDGSVTDVKVLRGIDEECDKEALRVVKLMPKWKPGYQKGKPVRVQFYMPVKFTLN